MTHRKIKNAWNKSLLAHVHASIGGSSSDEQFHVFSMPELRNIEQRVNKI